MTFKKPKQGKTTNEHTNTPPPKKKSFADFYLLEIKKFC